MEVRHRNHPSGCRNVIVLLLISGAALLLISPVYASTGVTISADAGQSFYLGEKLDLKGQNSESDSTYLFLTGPNLQAAGVNLGSPGKSVTSGNPDSFTVVKTKPDKTWEYSYYTANLPLDAGTYTIYAMSEPKAKDQSGPDAANIGLIIKKPYINSDISPLPVVKGQPFTISGSAEGVPPEVRVWIFGDNYVFNTTTPVNPDGSFTIKVDESMSGKILEGQNYLIVQHPMSDNLFDIDISGDSVRNLKRNNGTTLFNINGPGSLQGIDAANALITAFHTGMKDDQTLTNDTYAIFPFTVSHSGS